MTIYQRIKQLREQRGMSQQELAEKIGYKTASAVNKIELGLRDINQSKIVAFAKALDTTPAYLMGWEENESATDILSIPGIMPMPKLKKVPRLGAIACGEPIMAEENFEGYDNIPDFIDCDFSLTCKGDSMINARIYDGDLVFIKLQPQVENGEIAAVMVDGETTLKRVYLENNQLILQPENSAYRPFVYVNEQINNVRILGKAVWFASKVK